MDLPNPSSRGTRRTIREQWASVDAQDKEAAIRDWQALEAEEADVWKLRTGTAKTQRRQDQIRSLFEDTLKRADKLPPGYDTMSDLEKNKLLWAPANGREGTNELFLRLGCFFRGVLPNLPGRANKDDGLAYNTLTQYRDILTYWIEHSRQIDRSLDPIPKQDVFKYLTGQIRYIANKYNMRLLPDSQAHEIGLSELRQLIDFDMLNTTCMDVAEQHHLAWCIGRICGIRPSSLACSDSQSIEREHYLQWRDVEIVRDSASGQFTAKITFRHMKSNLHPDSVDLGKRGGAVVKRLVLLFRSPQQHQNIIFSVPHRLLVIALRRGILQGITSLDELFAGDLRMINIKVDSLEQPIFVAALPKGNGLVENFAPSSSKALSSYLALRGRQLGYSKPISFYSFRRRTANDMTRQAGTEHARLVMGHDAESRSLERWYLHLTEQVDVTAIGLQEPSRLDRFVAESDHLAIHRVDWNIHAPAINAMIRTLVNSDPDRPVNPTSDQQRRYIKRARQSAIKTILEEESLKQRQALTTVEFQNRISQLGQSKFVDIIIEKAKAAMAQAQDEGGEDMDVPVDDDTGLLVEREEALEDRGHQDGAEIRADLDESLHQDQELDPPTLGYEILAKTLMGLLLENSLSTKRDFKNSLVTCPLCQTDDTADLKAKSKVWPTRVKLEVHIKTAHTPEAVWKRKWGQRQGGVFVCPYCLEDGVKKTFITLATMVRHISQNDKPGLIDTQRLHYKQLLRDGWFEAGWSANDDPDTRERRDRLAVYGSRRKYKGSGWIFDDDEELQYPVSHPTDPDLQRGGGAPVHHPKWSSMLVGLTEDEMDRAVMYENDELLVAKDEDEMDGVILYENEDFVEVGVWQ